MYLEWDEIEPPCPVLVALSMALRGKDLSRSVPWFDYANVWESPARPLRVDRFRGERSLEWMDVGNLRI
jgi:hypothetical protein